MRFGAGVVLEAAVVVMPAHGGTFGLRGCFYRGERGLVTALVSTTLPYKVGQRRRPFCRTWEPSEHQRRSGTGTITPATRTLNVGRGGVFRPAHLSLHAPVRGRAARPVIPCGWASRCSISGRVNECRRRLASGGPSSSIVGLRSIVPVLSR